MMTLDSIWRSSVPCQHRRRAVAPVYYFAEIGQKVFAFNEQHGLIIILANDLFREAEATANKLDRVAKVKRAKEFANEALRYTPTGGEAGFTECIPTISLIQRIE